MRKVAILNADGCSCYNEFFVGSQMTAWRDVTDEEYNALSLWCRKNKLYLIEEVSSDESKFIDCVETALKYVKKEAEKEAQRVAQQQHAANLAREKRQQAKIRRLSKLIQTDQDLIRGLLDKQNPNNQ